MDNYKYLKINNNDVQNVEDLLYENKIEYTKYNNVLKAVCDEESERMLEELKEDYERQQKQSKANSLLEHVEALSDKLFENDNNIIDYFYEREVFEEYIERNDLV